MRNQTSDLRICAPMLYHWATETGRLEFKSLSNDYEITIERVKMKIDYEKFIIENDYLFSNQRSLWWCIWGTFIILLNNK